MFTGIVQATGIVRSIQRGPRAIHLALCAPDLARPIPDGASTCVSGVCLTVTRSDSASVEFDTVPETLTRTTLGLLSVGDRVNLERSLQAGDGLDGHIVQGHIDGTGRVRRVQTGEQGHVVTISGDESFMPFIIPQGSVAIDGVSLTIAQVDGNQFRVALIPATLAATTLVSLRAGDHVNIETDILVRTIVTTMQRRRDARDHPTLTVDGLRENGW
jgi:riboflavin synthase alpha subunit